MAHRTRKRLSKTELKKDPVNDALMKGMDFVQRNLRAILIGFAVVLLGILVAQSVISNAGRQAAEANARFYLAGQLYNIGLSSLQSGQVETAMGQLSMARNVASSNYQTHPGRMPGKRSAVLAAKIGIILGLESEVIPSLQDFLAADPGRELTRAASLHLAIALENRGGAADMANAEELFSEVLEGSESSPLLRWEALSGLSRIAYAGEDYSSASSWLDSALTVFPDTTAFIRYQMARLEVQGY